MSRSRIDGCRHFPWPLPQIKHLGAGFLSGRRFLIETRTTSRGPSEQCFFVFVLAPGGILRNAARHCRSWVLRTATMSHWTAIGPVEDYGTSGSNWATQARLNTKQEHLQLLLKDRCSISRLCCLGYVTDQATSWLEAVGWSYESLPFDRFVEHDQFM